jgi:alpha-beta hydrolase superfamily lysophospholipase
MIFPLTAAAVFTLATLVPAAFVGLVLLLLRRSQRRYWRAVLWLHAGLFLLHLFVVFPAALGLLGSRGLGTRPHERDYAGPRIDGGGTLLLQSWDSLARESASGRPEVTADVAAAAAAREHRIPSTDGVTLRAFRLEARTAPRAAVVLVHGLFRSAMELEAAAALFRDLGCECWLLELRNHGGSSRAPFTGGLRESDDVVAAVRYLRGQPGRARTPVVLYGVSIGTVAVTLALPRLDGLAAVVLDCPIDDLQAAAHRMLAFQRAGDRRSFFRMDEPWRSLTIVWLGLWSGFAVADVSPGDVLSTLPHDLPVLVVGAGRDDRAPPETVQRLFARLPMADHLKQLWIEPDAGHGDACQRSPGPYAERLRELLGRLRS